MKVASVVVYLDQQDAELLKRLAERNGLSLSGAVRLCVKYVLREVLVTRPFEALIWETQKGGAKDEREAR